MVTSQGTMKDTRPTMLITISLLLISLPATLQVGSEKLREFCENESFQAACRDDEVIVMRPATYGRMKLSRCIDRDYGYVGCFADVSLQVDRKCSGQRKCEIGIPDPELSTSNPCPRDLKPYLETGYRCLKVDGAYKGQCRDQPGGVPVIANHGYIAGVVTEETGVGSADCPWQIRAQPGQKINITLHDFGRSPKHSEVCHAYAILREKRHQQVLTVCNGVERHKHLYTTLSHSLEVRVLGPGKGRNFLLEYQVLGCPDVASSSSMWFKRRSNNVNKADVGCKGSETSWTITCEGNKWSGRLENCSLVVVGAVEQEQWGIVALPFGLSVAVIITIALVIGVIFMVIGLACMRWRRKRGPAADETSHKESTYYTGFVDSTQTKDPRRYVKRELPWPPPAVEQDNPYEENEYSYIAELPAPNNSCVQHPPPDYPPDPPKYFVLDPHAAEFTNGSVPVERYVATTPGEGPKPGLPRRKGTCEDLDAASRRNTHDFNSGYSYRDDKFRENNHVSV